MSVNMIAANALCEGSAVTKRRILSTGRRDRDLYSPSVLKS